jgi:hypothetical protein
MTMFEFIDFRIFPLVYENNAEGEGDQGEGDQGEGDQGGGDQGERGKEKPVDANKTFTQDELNRFLAEDRRKFQKNRDALVSELKQFRDSVTLTEQQKEQLETRIEQLQAESMTAQELAKKDKEKIVKEHQKEIKLKDEQLSYWKSTYAEEKIQRELTDAAIEHQAVSPIQIVNFLKPNTKLVEELKDGKPTGKWISRTTFSERDEKGDLIALELSVTEAVKRMKEAPEHWNLFNSGANGGLGQFNQTGGTFAGRRPPKDPVAYRQWRKENAIGK